MSGDPIRVLFVDDDVVTCRVMQRHCDNVKYVCQVFQDAHKCLEIFKQQGADIIITDLRMPKMNGLDFLSEIKEYDPDIPMLVMTGYSSVENAVEAMKRGASDFIKKPFDFSELKILIEKTLENARLRMENKKLKQSLDVSGSQFGMVGRSRAMLAVYRAIEKLAEVDCSILISGDAGTGKKLAAKAVHDCGPRGTAPFLQLECATLNHVLLEQELFGDERTVPDKVGLLQQAVGGTLYLEDVGSLPDVTQLRLLQIMQQSGSVWNAGKTRSLIDVRIIAASSRDLEQLMRSGELRGDFYRFLKGGHLHMPKLSERIQDIPDLVSQFVEEFNLKYAREAEGFDTVSMQRLCAMDWSGNVRELRSTVERCVILATSPLLSWDGVVCVDTQMLAAQAVKFSDDEFYSLTQLEQKYINHVLKCFKGKKTKVAEVLGIDKTTLWRKLRRYDGDGEVNLDAV